MTDVNASLGADARSEPAISVAASSAGDRAREAPNASRFRDRQRVRLLTEIRRTSLRIFAERGFDQVTVDEIAAAVGVSKSTFFRHVPTKEALLIEPLVEGISGIVALFEARPSTESVRDALTHAAIECTREVSAAELSVWSKALRTAPHMVTRISLVSDADRQRLIELAAHRLAGNGPDQADSRLAGLTITILLAAASYAFQCWIIDNDKGRESLEQQLHTALQSVSVRS